MPRKGLLLLALLWVAGSLPAAQAPKRVAIIIDTSGSMNSSDRPRYTVQLSQIISDLLSSGDELSVTRLPLVERSCSDGPDRSLSIRLNAGPNFRSDLGRLISYGGDNNFASPVRTAIESLGFDRAQQRLLLFIADSGGLGNCDTVLTREMMRLHASGALIAAVNIGSSTGAFETNPAFDFRTPALDSEQLVRSVAQVYQKFLGAKKVQTGRVSGGSVTVQIDPYVREAFLVVAADGEVAPMQQAAGNPSAASIDLDVHGGGHTVGLDRVTRGYRIVRMERPTAGRWTFSAPGLRATAGWMLLQDYAVGLRFTTTKVPANTPSVLQVELIDEQTGQRITGTNPIQGLSITVDVDGKTVTLTDDGKNGDSTAGDGVYTGTHTFGKPGKAALPVHLTSDIIDRTFLLETETIESSFKLTSLTVKKMEAGTAGLVKVRLEPVGNPSKNPEALDLEIAGSRLRLTDDGKGGDERPGDGIYSVEWTPSIVGNIPWTASGPASMMVVPVTGAIDVIGRLVFARPGPCALGELRSHSQGSATLDLSASQVFGSVNVEFTSNLNLDGAVLEADFGSGWQPVTGKPISLALDQARARAWPVRVRVGGCPQATAARQYVIEIAHTNAAGKLEKIEAPLEVTVIPDSFLTCWWPLIVAVLGVIAVGVIIYGFISPSRFPRQAGVMLSPEADINAEGFFHPIRAQRASGPGFYRDAAIYIAQDFRLSGKSSGALARLRADRKLIRIRPVDGASLWKQSADGEWIELPAEESIARAGILYRNDSSSLFFEIRNSG
jgi:hypothetical protein